MASHDGQIRVGLIGHGRSGSIIHGPLIEAVGGFRIVALGTSNPESARTRRDAPRVYADPRQLIAADDVDLVVIATPNDAHASLAGLALEAGKHVVIDKPFTLSITDADRLIEAGVRHDRLVTAFHNRRWDGDFLAVKAGISAGMVGEVMLFEAYWDRFRPAAPAAWRNSDTRGAGVLWDLGPHMIDQALLLFGLPEAISADIGAQRDKALADDYFHLTLHYGAMRCIVSASSVVAEARPRFAVHGTKGSLVIHGLDPTEEALIAGQQPGTSEFLSSLRPIQARLATASGTSELTYPAGDWSSFYRKLHCALAGKGESPVDPREARHVIRVIETVHDGRPARIPFVDN